MNGRFCDLRWGAGPVAAVAGDGETHVRRSVRTKSRTDQVAEPSVKEPCVYPSEEEYAFVWCAAFREHKD